MSDGNLMPGWTQTGPYELAHLSGWNIVAAVIGGKPGQLLRRGDEVRGPFASRAAAMRAHARDPQRDVVPQPDDIGHEEYEAWLNDEAVPRAGLIDRIRELESQGDDQLMLLSALHRRATELAFSIRAAECGAVTEPDSDVFETVFHVVFEIAEHAARRLDVAERIERLFAHVSPDAAAALVAMRRYELRDECGWPDAARIHYLRNLVAHAMEPVTPSGYRRADLAYWAGLIDMFPESGFDIRDRAEQYTVDEGHTAYDEGYACARAGLAAVHQPNPYPRYTVRHVRWWNGHEAGWLDYLRALVPVKLSVAATKDKDSEIA
ncbi:hypothetical protein QFZ94_000095 [Paraburkholderia sp. JPY465]|uniref:hypothetical protein n=1 Tax=Paraburkholderia sp. JPY465 TaxID=3042285 RepID=UPI003D1D8E67